LADGSGWKAVANLLKKDGYKVSVAQPPETSYTGVTVKASVQLAKMTCILTPIGPALE
jgi:hypothetical protein